MGAFVYLLLRMVLQKRFARKDLLAMPVNLVATVGSVVLQTPNVVLLLPQVRRFEASCTKR
jgi:hypothetical protein